MGVQVIGEKKRKRAETETGLTIDRLLRLSNYHWEARVLHDNGHTHVLIDPQTWETEIRPGDYCWATCNDLPPAQKPRLMPSAPMR